MAGEPKLGAVYLGEGRCLFRVWAPKVNSLAVHVIAPQDRLLPLQRQGEFFQGVFGDIPPGSLYFYRLDDRRERPDPASRAQPQGVHGPSQVVDLTFPWTDQQWPGRPLRDYIIYELHVGTFTAAGTFAAIIPQLPQLRQLGVTALELMPVAQYPGDRNWGYDGVYPFAVQHSYGGAAGLQQLVNACHRAGLAVILDVVYNHLGPEGNYFWEYGPYFTEAYRTPWGQALNFDQADSDRVREFFLANALSWFRDFHVDALRLDALHAIIDQSAQPFLAELAEAVARLGERLGRQFFLLAESDHNDPKLLDPPMLGGYGLHGHWLEDFHHALHALLTGEQDGYFQDYGTLAQLATAYRQGFIYTGQYSRYRRRRHGPAPGHHLQHRLRLAGVHQGVRHGAPAGKVAPYRFIAFSQNHDQVGNRAGGERLGHLVTPSAARLAALAVILAPFTPLLFMGEEYGETAPFLYFISHGDPRLIAAVRQGRREAMAACGCVSEAPDPQDPATFAQAKLNFSLLQQEPHHSHWQFYQELCRLRREMLTTVDLGLSYPEVALDGSPPLLQVTYRQADQAYCLLLNFHQEPAMLSLPPGENTWRLRLNSAAASWGGPGHDVATTVSGDETVTVPGLTGLVYHQHEELIW